MKSCLVLTYMMKNRFVTFDAFLYAIMVKDDILINKSCVELWIEKWYLQRIVSHLTVKIICCKNKFYFISYVIENSCDFYALSFLKRYKVLWDFGKHLVLLTCSWLKYLYIFFLFILWAVKDKLDEKCCLHNPFVKKEHIQIM